MARRDSSSGQETEEVLSPEELDIAADENVATLESGRYVVGSDGPPNEEKVQKVRSELAGAVEGQQVEQSTQESPTSSPQQQSQSADQDERRTQNTQQQRPRDPIDGQAVKAWVDEQLQSSESRYAYRIAAKSGQTVSHQQLASDDIGMAFDALLMWYAQQVGEGTAVEEALGILLAESSLRVRYPTRRLLAYLEENDLGPNDSIADLIRAVQDDDGLVFPPSQRNHD